MNIFHFQKHLAILLTLLVCSQIHAEWQQSNFDAMGTRVELEIWQSEGIDSQQVFGSVKREINRLEELLSPYIASSDISRVNNAAGQSAVEVSNITYQIIKAAQKYSELSNGAFDISFATVGAHYDYRRSSAPGKVELEKLAKAIDYKNIVLSVNRTGEEVEYLVRLNQPAMAIDLGGIAKGYTVDRVVKLMKEQGVESAAISIGGDSYFVGDRGPVIGSEQRLAWMVGIKHPRPDTESNEKNKEYALRLPLVSTAFSTSGDYERYFIDENGQRVHHIVNPRSGHSASKVMSASVVGSTSMDCDALSTTVFVLGAKKGLALIEQLDGYDVVIIDRDGKVHYSSGFR